MSDFWRQWQTRFSDGDGGTVDAALDVSILQVLPPCGETAPSSTICKLGEIVPGSVGCGVTEFGCERGRCDVAAAAAAPSFTLPSGQGFATDRDGPAVAVEDPTGRPSVVRLVVGISVTSQPSRCSDRCNCSVSLSLSIEALRLAELTLEYVIVGFGFEANDRAPRVVIEAGKITAFDDD